MSHVPTQIHVDLLIRRYNMEGNQTLADVSKIIKPGNLKKTVHVSLEVLNQLQMLALVFDNMYNGIIITDSEGYVTHFNKTYGEFLGVEPYKQIGKHCTHVVENTRMHIVAKTGKAEINQIQRIKGQDIVVQRIPIREDGKVIAVFGHVMFKDVKDLEKLARKLCFLQTKVKHYEQELLALRSTRYTCESIIGESKELRELKKEAYKATANKYPVLITGESGTGKELFAQAIHQASPRKIHPFVRINCSAIPKDLLESELFGYEKGAFTGAGPKGKPGKFELAHKGTIFLDEIGDMPLEMQPKILRVLEEKEFERIGSTSMIQSDFRLIAATNKNIEEMVEEEKFRKDLYYRLNVIHLNIPPLRNRRDDIVPLARHLLKQMSQDSTFAEIKMDKDAEQALINYEWPGNVRELVNVLERTLSSLETDVIRICDLPFYMRRKKGDNSECAASSLREEQFKAEKKAIIQALRRANSKSQAAKMLGIHRTLLYKKIKKYNITMDPD
jgi:PAS domain S-box-containing protein